MLVSHSHKFIYTKTVKTAGTSVESYFERFCMPPGEWTFHHFREEYESETGIIGCRGDLVPGQQIPKWWNHLPAAVIKQRIGDARWAEYFKFCVIRNPFEKAISQFYYLHRAQKQRWLQVADLNVERTAFEEWLKNPTGLVDRQVYLINGRFCLDDVIRLETLATDMERVCQRIGVEWHPDLLPALKAGHRPQNAQAADLYTEEARKMVAAIYAFDLDFFGYSFPATAWEQPEKPAGPWCD